MKPSKLKFFHHDDKSSSAQPSSSSSSSASSYWNNINITKWNREFIDKTFMNRRVLIKLLAACFMIALIVLIISSSSNSNSMKKIIDNENALKRQRLLINDTNRAINNDSIIDTSTEISIIAEVTASPQTNEKNNNRSDVDDVRPFTGSNIIVPQNEHTKKSNDEVTLTKNYVSLIMQFITIM